jgi:hypothetical protein
MLLGAALLSLPYFSLRQLLAMEQFLIQGQAQAQLLTAEGISTLLNGRDDLFNDLPLSAEGYASLYAHPLPSAIRLDGRDGDWDGLAERRLVFGADPDSGNRPDGSFDLILGERSTMRLKASGPAVGRVCTMVRGLRPTGSSTSTTLMPKDSRALSMARGRRNSTT